MKLEEKEIKKRLKNLEDWRYEDNALQVSYEFDDFKDAFTAMTRIAFEAEKLQHHPNWSNVYNNLEIELTTHDEGGVTKKDFELAHIIDELI
ncbi:MAG TPA: 4a-hydroxytetrahydrobiopterin dehydratase [Flavobacteriaceae bacterium]|nr:4a-hydroxytetrahydrobiopterin dehydratase [Flavobacteriaceae bacterium]